MHHIYRKFEFHRLIYLEMPKEQETPKSFSGKVVRQDSEMAGLSLVETILKGTNYKEGQQELNRVDDLLEKPKQIKQAPEYTFPDEDLSSPSSAVYNFPDDDVFDDSGRTVYDFPDDDVKVNDKNETAPKKVKRRKKIERLEEPEKDKIYLSPDLARDPVERAEIIKSLKKISDVLDRSLKKFAKLEDPQTILIYLKHDLRQDLNKPLFDAIDDLIDRGIPTAVYRKLGFYQYFLKVENDGSVRIGFKPSP